MSYRLCLPAKCSASQSWGSLHFLRHSRAECLLPLASRAAPMFRTRLPASPAGGRAHQEQYKYSAMRCLAHAPIGVGFL
eukprot:5879719-Pyramimonas_sp.AAC.2